VRSHLTPCLPNGKIIHPPYGFLQLTFLAHTRHKHRNKLAFHKYLSPFGLNLHQLCSCCWVHFNNDVAIDTGKCSGSCLLYRYYGITSLRIINLVSTRCLKSKEKFFGIVKLFTKKIMEEFPRHWDSSSDIKRYNWSICMGHPSILDLSGHRSCL
jgi:hypothetical protein